jgi:hypothetical protein
MGGQRDQPVRRARKRNIPFGARGNACAGNQMILYRGIAVPTNRASKVIADIRSRGLLPDQGRWRFRFYDLKPLLPELRQRSIVTTADTELEGEMPTWVCACGDEMGAIYYATKHNRDRENNTPVLISFDANLRDVIIDGRDFLYRLSSAKIHSARPVAERAYGREILPYLDRAWATDDQNQRVAMCHLATQDDQVFSAHLNNEAVIEGRYNTRFRSVVGRAFFGGRNADRGVGLAQEFPAQGRQWRR